MVSAFTLPGGYVHVTRGLPVPANSEAVLAVSRESRFGSLLTDMIGLSAGTLGASYSRDREIESDSLGVRCLTRAGYDCSAMARQRGRHWDLARGSSFLGI